jgi:hypothetical protein
MFYSSSFTKTFLLSLGVVSVIAAIYFVVLFFSSSKEKGKDGGGFFSFLGLSVSVISIVYCLVSYFFITNVPVLFSQPTATIQNNTIGGSISRKRRKSLLKKLLH